MNGRLKDIGIEVLGWILVLAGIAAIVLPGPGLLMLFAGLALLANRYEWAERRLEPVRKVALKGAKDSVSSKPKIAYAAFLAIVLVALGILWGVKPSVPGWWPLADKYWLAGGWGTGSTLILSGFIAAGILIYSYMQFRPKN